MAGDRASRRRGQPASRQPPRRAASTGRRRRTRRPTAAARPARPQRRPRPTPGRGTPARRARRFDHVRVTCRVTAVGTTWRPPSRTSRRSPSLRPRGRAIVTSRRLFGVAGAGARRARLSQASPRPPQRSQVRAPAAGPRRRRRAARSTRDVERHVDRRPGLVADEGVAHPLDRDRERRESRFPPRRRSRRDPGSAGWAARRSTRGKGDEGMSR